MRLVPLPQSNQIIDASLSVFPLGGIRIDGEYARSIFGANRVSTLDDSLPGGNAFSFGATLSPQNIRLGSLKLERIDLSLRERYVDRNFVSIDRTREIEFNRKWGLDTLLQEEEEIREATLTVGTSRGVPDRRLLRLDPSRRSREFKEDRWAGLSQG